MSNCIVRSICAMSASCSRTLGSPSSSPASLPEPSENGPSRTTALTGPLLACAAPSCSCARITGAERALSMSAALAAGVAAACWSALCCCAVCASSVARASAGTLGCTLSGEAGPGRGTLGCPNDARLLSVHAWNQKLTTGTIKTLSCKAKGGLAWRFAHLAQGLSADAAALLWSGT